MQFGNYIIRHPEPADAKALCDMVTHNKERLLDYFPMSSNAMQDAGSTRNYIMECKAREQNREMYVFTIFIAKTNKPVGMLFIKSIDWRIPKAELAYYIDKEHEGKGIISEALKFLIGYAFNTLKINKLFLRAAKSNIASQRVAIKNGFILEGVMKNDFKMGTGKLIDLHYYGLVKKRATV